MTSFGPTSHPGPSVGPPLDRRPQPLASFDVRGKCDDLVGKLTEIRRLADARDDVPDGVEAALDDADESVEGAMRAMEDKI